MSVIVENKPGASTLLGAREVQKSAPDGHTLLYTIATHVQMPHLYKVPPWNVFTDFTPDHDRCALRDRAHRAHLRAVQYRS